MGRWVKGEGETCPRGCRCYVQRGAEAWPRRAVVLRVLAQCKAGWETSASAVLLREGGADVNEALDYLEVSALGRLWDLKDGPSFHGAIDRFARVTSAGAAPPALSRRACAATSEESRQSEGG